MINRIDKLTLKCQIAFDALGLKQIWEIDGIEATKDILLQDDTLLPIVVAYVNQMSETMLGRNLLDFNLKTNRSSLCYVVAEEPDMNNKTINKDYLGDTVTMMFIMEAIHFIFTITKEKGIDLTKFIDEWRASMQKMPQNEIMKYRILPDSIKYSPSR